MATLQPNRFGWKPDLPDIRDKYLKLPARAMRKLPRSVDMRPDMVPVVDQHDLGSCFPAGTRIRLADGTEKPIEKVSTLEKVLTAEGNIGCVIGTMVRQEPNELLRVTLHGHNFLRTTTTHPILTKRGYVKAQDLTEDDFVAMPRYLPSDTRKVIQTADYVKYRTCISERHREFNGLPGRSVVSTLMKPIPDIIHLTPGFGRIVGLFLAEGNTDRSRVVWTFGDHERETLVAELITLLRTELNIEARVQHRAYNHNMKVIIDGTDWGKLFEGLFSTGAGNKKLPGDIASGPKEFLEAILYGWLAGDGWRIGERQFGVSISHDLALAMFDIAQALGLRPVLNYAKSPVNRWAKVRQPRWTLSLWAKTDNWRAEQTDTHIFRKVRKILRESFTGPVFNLSIDKDQSYVAEGIGVHNCTANAAAGLVQYVDKKSGTDPYFAASRLFIYYNTRILEGTVDYDSGASIRNSIKALVRWGFPPETEYPYDIPKFTNKPPASVYKHALKEKITKYERIPHEEKYIKSCLARGFPITFGFTVYESFDEIGPDNDFIMPMPKPTETILGGHAVLLIGYDDVSELYIVRNSWGEEFGSGGNFMMPFEALHDPNFADDFWTVNFVP